jgi:hypothetical protein
MGWCQDRQLTLKGRWKLARREREVWEEQHEGFLDFWDPEYQTLWEKETLAESRYLFHGGSPGLVTSLSKYATLKSDSERKMSDK